MLYKMSSLSMSHVFSSNVVTTVDAKWC